MNDASKRRLSDDEFDLVSHPDFYDDEEYGAAIRDFNAGSSETAPHRPHQGVIAPGLSGSGLPKEKAKANATAAGIPLCDGYGTPYIPSTMMHGSGTVVDHWEGDASIPMPQDIPTLEQWSKVVCALEGFKGLEVKGKSFGELLAESHVNPKMKSYLSFLVRRFQGELSDCPKTQGPELTAFCLRCYFVPVETGGYKRTFK